MQKERLRRDTQHIALEAKTEVRYKKHDICIRAGRSNQEEFIAFSTVVLPVFMQNIFNEYKHLCSFLPFFSAMQFRLACFYRRQERQKNV